MITVKLLPIVTLIIILCKPSLATYPVYGTKRYASQASALDAYLQLPLQQYVRAQRYPMTYYDMYDYPDNYLYQPEAMTRYPVYYPAPHTSKYELYQSVLPYYYNERYMPPASYPYSEYTDPLKQLEEIENEEYHDADSAYYPGSGYERTHQNLLPTEEESIDDVNAAFMHNLIMSQLYQDKLQKESFNSKAKPTKITRWEAKEDEDVRELKSLAKQQKNPRKPDDDTRRQHFNINKRIKYNDYDQELPEEIYDDADKFGYVRETPNELTTPQPKHKSSTDIPKVVEDPNNYQEAINRLNNRLSVDRYNSYKASGILSNEYPVDSRYETAQSKYPFDDQMYNEQLSKFGLQPDSIHADTQYELVDTEKGFKLPYSIYGQAFMAFASRKVPLPESTPTPMVEFPAVSTEAAPKLVAAGMKEEVMMRPATPIRKPFPGHVLGLVSKQHDRKRTPSVYDKIKHMLDAEKNLEKSQELKPAMRKRIVSTEDSLTRQLTKLKKEH